MFRVQYRIDWVDVEGVSTRYLEAGKKGSPVVILLHGATGSLEYFCANIAAYAAHFHVFAIDMMGSGFTEKPDYPYTPEIYRRHVCGFMDAMNVARASLVGVALGSAICVHMAHHHPQRVERIVMASPGGILVDEHEAKAFIAGVKTRRGNAVEDLTWDGVKSVVSSLFFNPEASMMDDLVSVRLACYSVGDIEVNMRNMLSSAQQEQFLSHQEWRELQTPILVIAPVSIEHMFLHNARLIGQLAPNAQVVDLQECRIWPQFEQADAFNAATIPFLQGETYPSASLQSA